ncbi:MAG: FG-GAP repeat protein [Anaerolineales bacterium]|nr:FG-GAP repeat protein [Anaerolineales bacterium]
MFNHKTIKFSYSKKFSILTTTLVLFLFLILTVAKFSNADQVYAQSTDDLLTLIADDLEAEDWLGINIATEGKMVAIGARYGDGVSENSGVVYIFEKTRHGWIQTGKLMANDGEPNDNFGEAIAINGNTIVIGSRLNNENGVDSGGVYVFEKTGRGRQASWEQVAKLVGDDTESGDHFGVAIDIEEDTIIAGAPLHDGRAFEAGAIYVFRLVDTNTHNWQQVSKIIPDSVGYLDKFGRKLSIDGTTLVVTAYRDDDLGSNSGAVYIFEQDANDNESWNAITKLTASDGEADDSFGISVDLDRTTLVVGARYADSDIVDTGAAYVYRQTSTTSWEEVAKLVAPEPASNASFGWDTAVYGNHILVGAPDHPNADFTKTGAVYLYHRDEGGADKWGLVNTFTSPNPGYWDGFGFEVEIGQYNALIGSLKDDDIATDAGMAYLYPLDHSGSR